MAVLPSVCPLDCPDACSLEATVEDGKLVALDGSRANPVTGGTICSKVRGFAAHVHGPERLLHPAVRDGAKGSGRFRRVTWEEALDRVVAGLVAARAGAGAESILPLYYGGSNGFLSQETTDARLFRRLGASRLARTVCAAPSGAAATGLYGKMAGVAYQDYAAASLIVIWGANPSATGIHLVPYVQQALRRGARLVVVDPRRIRLAERADLHLALRPGTDLPVALSLIRWLFESGNADTGFLAAHAAGVEALRERAEPWTFEKAAAVAEVPAADLEALARMYAEASPAVIRCGWGPERNRNGGSAIAAILALPAVAGKFGVRGGGYTMSNSGLWRLTTREAVAEPEPPTRLVNMNLVGEALTSWNDPPIRALFVYNSNPLMTLPNQEKVLAGLRREDLFTVVFEQVMTDTALWADVLLPATTFLEREEISRGYGAIVLQEAKPVLPPVGEARSNHEVFLDLARRLGLSRPGDPETLPEIRRALLEPHPWGPALGSALDAGGIAFPEYGGTPIQFVDVFPLTADRRIHLFPPELESEAPQGLYRWRPDPGDAGHPLACISPSTDRTISSTLGQLHRALVPLEMSPADAAARGLADGARVRVSSAWGEVHCPIRIVKHLRPGVVVLPKGIWSHNTLNGRTANALSPDTLSDLGAGACFNDARVEVTPL